MIFYFFTFLLSFFDLLLVKNINNKINFEIKRAISFTTQLLLG